jgi:hypothetical protein
MLTDDLGKLNSLTKYPSIPTYHTIGDKGVFTDEHLDLTGPLIVTEKVDGVNARILLLPDGDYILGTREEFVYAKGDRIGNPAEGVLEHVKAIAERISTIMTDVPILTVVFGELYGHGIGRNGREYGNKSTGFRVFDVMTMDQAEAANALAMPREKIASWRQHGHQPFIARRNLDMWCHAVELDMVPVITEVGSLPTGHEDVLHWLTNTLSRTLCGLDPNVNGQCEGVVVRSADRKQIAKIRFQDYQRTLRAARK